MLLAAATILGGLAALWFFFEKAKAIPWERARFSRRRAGNGPADIPDEPSAATVEFPPDVDLAVRQAFPDHRLPAEGDLHDDWRDHYDPRTMFPVACSGDFRATGRRDLAMFLISLERPSFKVVVALRDNHAVKVVDLTHGAGMPQNLFLRTIPPGAYEPGESTRQTTTHAVRRLRLVGEGINFGTFESADCIYYWVPTTERFERVWMSD